MSSSQVFLLLLFNILATFIFFKFVIIIFIFWNLGALVTSIINKFIAFVSNYTIQITAIIIIISLCNYFSSLLSACLNSRIFTSWQKFIFVILHTTLVFIVFTIFVFWVITFSIWIGITFSFLLFLLLWFFHYFFLDWCRVLFFSKF